MNAGKIPETNPRVGPISRRRSSVAVRLAAVVLITALRPTDAPCQRAGDRTAEARAQAEEQACVLNLRLLNTAQGTYWGGESTKGFARNLKELGPSGSGIIEAVLAKGTKDGYHYHLSPERTAPEQRVKHYTLTARPIKRLTDSQRSFFTDESGVIRSTTENRAATRLDKPVDK